MEPLLKQEAWLDNLQLAGPPGTLVSLQVEADLELVGAQRLNVRFRRGGWMGRSFPARLDITVLDEQLRICRGKTRTSVALLRRSNSENSTTMI